MALRALLGASIGLGALDLAWINLALAPRVLEAERSAPAELAVAPAAPEPVAPPVAVSPEPIEVTPVPAARSERVYFATMSAKLDAAAQRALQRMIEQAGSEGTFVLEGHADYRGDEALNQSLSKDRAHAVRDYLTRLGVARARMRVGYLGEKHAVLGDELWRDRRVEIQITGGQP